jgi:hypothetical protein
VTKTTVAAWIEDKAGTATTKPSNKTARTIPFRIAGIFAARAVVSEYAAMPRDEAASRKS